MEGVQIIRTIPADSPGSPTEGAIHFLCINCVYKKRIHIYIGAMICRAEAMRDETPSALDVTAD